jgi:hypothetical protein
MRRNARQVHRGRRKFYAELARHSLQSGKGNKTADWVACGASKSLSCRPWDAASSLPLNGWVPNEGILSGSPRRPFLLKGNQRFFHTRRYASLDEVVLLVFDRQFDLSICPPHGCWSLFQLSRRGADQVFIFFGDQNWMFQRWAYTPRGRWSACHQQTAGRFRDFCR